MQYFFTICATNYLAFARQLGDSVRLHHPEASLTIWLLDRGELPELPEGFLLRYADELLPPDEWEQLTFYYELLELATAVKPLCFRRHFDEDATGVVYLDPDIVLFRPLDEVAELLAQGATGVLTPHVLAPLPRDDAAPDDLELLTSGVFNLGFLALSAGAASAELLDWWWGWLRTQCFVDKTSGTFTDQKWLNFAPLFWPKMSVLRDTTYNVAYWNLPQRHLERVPGGFTVDGRALTFFHFSGFDPENPGVLSKHQTRIDVGRRGALADILGGYAGSVLAAGHATLKTQTPPPVTFAGGIGVDPIARSAFRDALRRGMSFRDPRAQGSGTFFNLLTATVPRDLHSPAILPLSRYMITLYQLRSDLKQTYPDLYGTDRAGFLEWVRRRAVVEMQADPKMIDRLLAPQTADPVPSEAGVEGGVNLVGYLRAALGLGEAARGYALAMREVGIPLHTTDATYLTASPIDETAASEHPGPGSGPKASDLPINLIHINADQLLRLRHTEGGAELLAGRYNIGVWAWETQEFPEAWHDRFDLLDEVWVPSAFVADAVSSVSPLPVVRIPHVIQVPHVPPDRARFGLAEGEVVFLFTFDFNSTSARKNPQATLEAFRRAFAPGDPVRLVLKSINASNQPAQWAALKRTAEGLPVTFIDEALSGDDRFVLLASCDCFVSLHRAEGFGLGLAEAMAMGKPVIATGWSGNMDFMTASNSFPVEVTLAPLVEEAPPYPAGTVWAVPDVDHAARLMRQVVDDPAAAREIGRLARRDIEASHAPAVIGRLILKRLQHVERTRRRPGAAGVQPGAAVQGRSVWFRTLRQGWRLTLRVAPMRYHPRLHRMTSRLRAFLAVG